MFMKIFNEFGLLIFDINKYLSDIYKVKYDKMILGTTENNIPFYLC